MSTSSKRIIVGAVVAGCLTAAGCTTIRETQPAQTAREQIMMSRAADLASVKIEPNVPKDNAIFVDATNFTSDATARTGYAIARITAQLLSEGYHIVGSADAADTIAEVSTGALSIDQSDTLFGLPSTPIPIPLSGTLTTPEVAIYKKAKRTGVAKFLVSFYSAKTGALQDVVGPVYGFSHFDRYSLFGFGWKHSNLLPPEALAAKQGEDPAQKTGE
ncbi:DUF6655 family protein [Salinisphaera sp.]|uniref:DUF6655 family protein n=1 Tax=Salinisphaera sp. TaxID=1914330 RepID=UPI002D79D642|nr:DUF6655 family protein [Salinisphaera sp.]HET7312902.1 DUF6655 family protein [Salinisphaera sp.]